MERDSVPHAHDALILHHDFAILKLLYIHLTLPSLPL